MIARAGSGWQTVLADLSLILFMMTAAAASELPAAAPAQTVAVLPALSEPVAVWRAGAEAPRLRDWLARTGPDPHLRLTIMAAPEQAQAALALAAEAGRPARVLLEPGTGSPSATLTYDQGGLAQPLQPIPQPTTARLAAQEKSR